MYELKPLTKADHLRSVRLAVVSLQGQVEMLERAHRSLFHQIWNNPNLTSQEVMDEFDNKAALLFRDSAALQTLFKTIIKDYEVLEPGLYTINQDGTVDTQ